MRVTRFRCGSKAVPAGSERAYSSGELPSGFGVAVPEPFQTTCARPSRPTATCFQPRAFDADEYAQAIGGLRVDFVEMTDDTTAFDGDPVS